MSHEKPKIINMFMSSVFGSHAVYKVAHFFLQLVLGYGGLDMQPMKTAGCYQLGCHCNIKAVS